MSDLDPAAVMAEHKGAHKCWGGGWNQPQQHNKTWGPCLPYRLAEALDASRKLVASWRASHAECERQYGQLLDEFNALADAPEQS